ncbi:hypothetical protein VTJ49DRAFT_5768 [Mycothermus thermophilus]|uniref:LPXTG-motif cell wall anchor domain protein n=1 Tax=Humicola insolens TaxID=85995 RepID=A0ABR3VQ39_HUMIN
MTSTTLSARSPRAPTVSYSSSAQPQQQHHHLHHHHHYHLDSLTSHPYNSSYGFANSDDNLHAHRQSHNASKLPAFRFADLRKDRISLSSLQNPTPLAPLLSQPSTDRPTTAHISTPSLHHYSSFPDRPVSIDAKQTGTAATSRTRSLKFDLASAAAHSTESLPATRRPSSDDVSAARSRLASVVAAPLRRRLTDSAAVASSQPLPSPREAPVGPDDRKLRPLVLHRPGQVADTTAPAPAPAPSTSSAHMPSRRVDAGHRARRSLDSRRGGDSPRYAPSENGEMTTTTDNDNTADIFMKIAGEDPAPPTPEKRSPTAEPSSISRLFRTHRRPLSAAVNSHETSPAGHVSRSRRLSDQRESSRSRQSATDSQADAPSREPSFRASARTSLPQISTTESSSRAQTSQTPQKPSLITPRQISFKESLSESASSYQRRRQSVTENNNNLSSSRAAQYRSANLSASQSRIYQSSPLVPKSANVVADGAQQNGDAGHMEGTESSSSTAAASVWDEVDDLKSRILRLEQKGKLSTASVAGPSDDRPRTATTAATTVSASPKRGSGPGSTHGEGSGSGSATRDSLLLSALSKTKDRVSPEVFSALELVATDALGLSNMIPPVGQPGPISSRASTVGSQGEGVTDRQLRKKAESICRSLTELCLALADEANQKKQQAQTKSAAPRDEALLSPTVVEPVVSAARRPSAIADTIVKGATSSRAPSSLGEKRKTMLASIAVPSSRYATAPSTPMESATAGRKSSLLLSRIRRTAPEEPEEPLQTGRRSSLLLRSRRTGSEEPEERPREKSRKASHSLRSRKVMSDSEDESRATRAPSRAITEVNGFRPAAPTSSAQPAVADNPTTPSVLPRRSRMIPAAIATRFATSLAAAGHHSSSGSGSSVPATPARKYLERSSNTHLDRTTSHGHERSSSAAHTALAERLAEERAQMQQRQQSALDRSALLSRSGSLGRRGRETGIPSLRG